MKLASWGGMLGRLLIKLIRWYNPRIKLNICSDCGKLIDKRGQRCRACNCRYQAYGKQQGMAAIRERFQKEIAQYQAGIPIATIARERSTSRQSVQNILQRAGVWHKRPKQEYTCASCGKALSHRNLSGKCRKCYWEERRIELTCDVCGLKKKITRSDYHARQKAGRRFFFCSKCCQGKWLGERNRGRN